MNKQGRTFITSDVHGCFDEFIEGLKERNFSKEDILYVVGDCNDKGPKSLETLDFMMEQKNIIQLKGNHEYVFQLLVEGDDRLKALDLKSEKSFFGLVEKREKIEKGYKEKIYNYIKKMPHYKIINDNFILMHAGFDMNISMSKAEILEKLLDPKMQEELVLNRSFWISVFDRENRNNRDFGAKDFNIIIGHTPMQNAFEDEVKIGKRKNDCGKLVICTDTGVFTPYKDCRGQLSIIEIDKEKIVNEWYIKSRMVK